MGDRAIFEKRLKLPWLYPVGMSVTPIPNGQRSVTPHITVSDGHKAIAFYREAFGAEVVSVSKGPDGKILHADLQIGDSHIFLNDQFGPPAAPSAAMAIHLWVADVDEAWARATKAGATTVMELADQFWGDRYGQVSDPFGHRWSLAMRIEDLSADEIAKRGVEFFKQMGGG